MAEPRSASLAGFGFFHQHIRKGKVVITKTSKEKRLLLGSFLAPETDMIFGDGVGASPVGNGYKADLALLPPTREVSAP